MALGATPVNDMLFAYTIGNSRGPYGIKRFMFLLAKIAHHTAEAPLSISLCVYTLGPSYISLPCYGKNR